MIFWGWGESHNLKISGGGQNHPNLMGATREWGGGGKISLK